MPYQSDAQITGDAGELWFQAQLPPGWILQRPTRDVGVDGVVVVCDRTILNGIEFRAQVKSSLNLNQRDSHIILRDIKRSTMRYWFLSPLLTMIVACDLSRQCGYYCWHNDLLETSPELFSKDKQDTVSVFVPTENLLISESWIHIRERLTEHYGAIMEALSTVRHAKSMLPAIYSLSSSLRQLHSVDHQTIPIHQRSPQQEGILALIELIQHRDILQATSNLLSELVSESEGAQQLRAWRSSYESKVHSVFPSLEQLPPGDNIPADYKLAYAQNLIHSVRPQLMQCVLELIMLLAKSDEIKADKNSPDSRSA